MVAYFLGQHAKAVTVSIECGGFADLLGEEVRPHNATILRELHWLRVPERIQFRLCVLAYRCLTGTAPQYLADTLSLSTNVAARCRLRSRAVRRRTGGRRRRRRRRQTG